jgi:hypothetical protein
LKLKNEKNYLSAFLELAIVISCEKKQEKTVINQAAKIEQTASEKQTNLDDHKKNEEQT